MIAVLVCSIVNSGLIVGMLAGIATGMFRSRGAIGAALRGTASPPVRPEASRVRPAFA